MTGPIANQTVGGDGPLISVIIPAYNCADVLPAAVASVAAQTATAWEVIVVDDCSSDDPAAALSAYRTDSRVRVIRQPRNGGATAARNTGIAAATGRFVAFLDADDSWAPTKLERQLVAVMARPDPDKVFCVTRTIVNVADGHHLVRPIRGKRPDERMDEFIFVSGGFCQTSSFLVSRTLAASIGFRELSTGEDHLFAIDMVRLGAEYLLVEETLTTYNDDFRPGRLSSDKTLARGEAFMADVRDLISPKALLAYQARYLGALVLKRSPIQGLGLVARAVAKGALPPRFAVTLMVRTLVPATAYHRFRSMVLGRR